MAADELPVMDADSTLGDAFPVLTEASRLRLDAPIFAEVIARQSASVLVRHLIRAGFATVGDLLELTPAVLANAPGVRTRNTPRVVALLGALAAAVTPAEPKADAPPRTLRALHPTLVHLQTWPLDSDELQEHLNANGGWSLRANLFVNGCRTVGDLLDLEPDDILAWQHFGPARLGQVLDLLTDIENDALSLLALRADPAARHGESVRQMAEIVAWARAARGASTWGDVRMALDELTLPADVAAGLALVREVTVNGVDDDIAAPTLIVTGWLSSLDAREEDLVWNRLATTQPDTLREVGLRHGIGPARVGAIQSKLTSTLYRHLTSHRWRTVRWKALALRDQLGNSASLSVAAAATRESDQEVASIFLWLAGYERSGEAVRRRERYWPSFDDKQARSIMYREGQRG